MNTCLLWQGPINDKGYGRIYFNGKRQLVHRVAYKKYYGIDPKKLNVCHTCDTPLCINPDHLFLGTQADNLADMRAKGRGKNPPLFQGEDHYEGKLSAKDVLEIRKRYTGKRGERRAFAKEFEVSDGMIGHVVHGRKWKCI